MRLGDGGFISTGEYVCLYLNATVFIIVLFLFNFFLIVIVTTNDIVIVSVIVSGDAVFISTGEYCQPPPRTPPNTTSLPLYCKYVHKMLI